jgi:SepF-like predicted cell division protein (DUF552 family)
MKVNFNNLRKKTCFAYDRLADKLNNAIKEYEKEYSEKGTLMIDCDEIQKEMDDLKQFIGSIAMCYNENDPDMKDVFEEIYPGREVMVDFNPDDDEERS